jgi:hypothetical protein
LLALPDVVQLLWVVEAVQVLLLEAWAEESQSIQRDSLMSFALLHCFRHAPFYFFLVFTLFNEGRTKPKGPESAKPQTVTKTESQTKQLSALKLEMKNAVKQTETKESEDRHFSNTNQVP